MGHKQSGFLQRQNDHTNYVANTFRDIIQQFMIDTLQMTLHEDEGMGYDKITRISEEWEKKRREYYPAIDPKDPLCDVKQEHMQRVFRSICKKHPEQVLPFYDRYPRLKRVKYTK